MMKTEPDPEVPPTPDKSRYLRRKTPQKLRKSQFASRRMISILRIMGKVGAFLLVMGFLASIFIYSRTSNQFMLRKVAISGCSHLNPQRLEAIIRKEFPGNALNIDLMQLRSRLEEEVWVRGVEIRRILPSELIIYVQERTPAVIFELQGELMLGDESGILLDQYDPKYGKLDLPVFKGMLGNSPERYRENGEENARRVRLGLKLLSELDGADPLYARNISEVSLSDPANLKLLLVDDIAEIFLGDKDFLPRFRTLMANMNQYQELKSQYNDIAEVDLRFDGQIIYRPRLSQGGTVNEAAPVGP
jgi:cell division septal protein FtsQ